VLEGHRRDGSAWTRRGAALLMFVLFVSFTLAASAAAQETGATTPAVAPPSGDLAYDVPLPAWLVDAVTELKLEFAEGLAAETVALADQQMTGDVGSLTETVNELAAVGQRIDATMSRMGAIDSSFGISGLSQLLTADGAVRDTLFGFVVWHESAQGQSRKIAADLERTVDRMVGLGRSARTQAGQLSGSARQMGEALKRKDYASIVGSAAVMARSTDDLAGLAAATEEAATALEKVVWQVREGGGTSLEEHWGQVLLDTSEARRLVAKMEPSVASMKTSAGLLAGMAGALQVVVQAPSLMASTKLDAAGAYHIPWTVFQSDVKIARSVNEGFLGGAGEEYPQSARASVQGLLGKMVTADRLLAERAVEYTSTEVGRAVDRLEERYKKAAGFSENDTDRKREEALQKVDLALRGNRDLDAARISARAARAALDDGKTKEERGQGFEADALTQYQNAWAHALNAGAAAAKAVGAATSK
jgi:hypothetical protein